MQEMVEAGIEYCFMEVSSHALQQKRIIGLNFTGGVFTNISHDHLDYHKSFQNYIKAKKIFFDELPSDAFALINQDDKNANIMVQNSSATIYKYALKSMADYKARILENHFDGTMIRINDQELWIRLIGKFNAYNILAIYGVAMLLGQDNKSVLTALSTLKAAPGRFEYTVSEDHKTGIVDYAHTPDALSNVLKTIVQVRKPGQKIYTVVGAGGNRDKEKRPLMAKVASELSDRVILTSDNPRDEEPEEIIADMLEGVKESKNILTITNRKEAIRGAVMMASPGDIILVAGKGHETYQEVKGVRSDFDDREVLKESFKSI
jgi:UDP-N-acetylmuramoyl-L-alanyl-D-glutamate--2,6-diaminopimelate ligase